jgi:hypothetical protein
VNALAFERVEVRRERGHQRLALAGFHFRDLAGVQHHAAHQLDVEVAHVQHAQSGLAHDGECFDEQVVDRRAFGDPLTELDGLLAKLLVGEGVNLRLEGADLGDGRAQPLDLPFVLGADDLREKLADHLNRDEGPP